MNAVSAPIHDLYDLDVIVVDEPVSNKDHEKCLNTRTITHCCRSE